MISFITNMLDIWDESGGTLVRWLSRQICLRRRVLFAEDIKKQSQASSFSSPKRQAFFGRGRSEEVSRDMHCSSPLKRDIPHLAGENRAL